MDEDQRLSKKYVELDIIFSTIKFNEPLTETLLIEKVREDHPALGVNAVLIKSLLNQLVEDKHVIIDEERLFISPISKDFLGYAIEKIKNKEADKEKSKKDQRYKNIPIVLTTLSILSTLYFSVNNLQISKENLRLNTTNLIKDSTIKALQAEIAKLKIDSNKLKH